MEPSGSMGRARSAALRLKHDLGKYLRWSAPDVREADAEELRSRLRQDLLATRVLGERTFGALEVYEAWRAEDGPALDGIRSLADVESSVEELRALLPRLDALDPAGLAALDDATRRVAAACAAVHREVVRLEEAR